MKLMRRFFDFYVNSSIHVATAVVSLASITVLEFNLTPPTALWFFIFFGTVTGYNFVKYAKIAKLHHHSLTDMLKTIQVFSFVSFGLWIYFALQLSLETLITAGLFGVFTFFYAVPLPYSKNLRTLAGLKVFIVALVWAGTTVIVPIIASSQAIEVASWITFIQRVFIVIALTLPFDIRDMQYDASKLKTLPQQFGLQKVKVFGIVLVVLALFLEGFKDELAIPYFSSLFLICVLIGGVLVVTRQSQSRYFASFFVESIPIIWCGCLLIFRYFLL